MAGRRISKIIYIVNCMIYALLKHICRNGHSRVESSNVFPSNICLSYMYLHFNRSFATSLPLSLSPSLPLSLPPSLLFYLSLSAVELIRLVIGDAISRPHNTSTPSPAALNTSPETRRAQNSSTTLRYII